ncbi:Ig-like domain-containing protein, partial [Rosenbergiella epipactidis]|uniref:Ig-like domain-containing protein n=1 Tax=Rosenbergiella epipactidis TaxID=1544694 RepID=UPI0020271229
MINIVALSKEKGSSSTVHSPEVTLDSASILKISVSREDIKSFSRVNNDLIIELNDHEKITIKDFFKVGPNGQHSDLVIADPGDGALWWLENPGTSSAKYTSINSLTEAGTQVTEDAHIGAWVMAGATLLGIGAMLLGSSNSHHNNSENSDSSEVTPSTPDTSGKDTTAPVEPNNLKLSDNGKSITGKGEAGSTITVKDGNGKELGHATVGSDGTFSVTFPSAQTNGQSLTVTATDAAGNSSPAATITAHTVDTTAPAEPSGVQFSDDGKTISGRGEAGSTITVKDGNGKELDHATVGSDGTFSVTLPSAQTNGESLTVTATDAAGNSSPAATITAPDTTAPAEPSGVQLSDDGKTITGKAEVGATISVKDSDGKELGHVTVGSDGTFSVTLPSAQTNGESLTVTATDAAGNTSPAATVTAPTVDTTAPTEPSGVQFSDDGKTISGRGEAGSTITVKDGNGKELGHATVGSDGTFSVTLPSAQTNGESLTVTATDGAGNTSPAATVTAPTVDTTAPTEPSGVQFSDDGKTISGRGEAGSTITVKDGNGKELGHATVGSDGTFSVTLPSAQTNGESLTVTATDAAGNSSPAATVTAHTVDTTAPAEPSGVQLSDDGKTISGRGEAGSTITVKDGNGKELGHVTVGNDGTFSVTLPSAQTNGESLTVTATDGAGNTSPAATVTAPTVDTTAPTEPSGVQFSDDGKTITGKAEVGATISVKDSDGKELGHVTVGSDGTFS